MEPKWCFRVISLVRLPKSLVPAFHKLDIAMNISTNGTINTITGNLFGFVNVSNVASDSHDRVVYIMSLCKCIENYIFRVNNAP